MNKDVAKMSQPNTWPNLLLPVKRKVSGKGFPYELGFLTGDGPNVYLGNIFDKASWGEQPISYAD